MCVMRHKEQVLCSSLLNEMEMIMGNEVLKKTTRSEGQNDVSESVIKSLEEWRANLEKSGGKEKFSTLTVVAHDIKGNEFEGRVKFRYGWAPDGKFHCFCDKYKIAATGGHQNSHKANLHFSFDSTHWWGNDSSDSLRQDNVWHDFNVGTAITAHNRARVFARFDFDVGGGDDPEAEDTFYLFKSEEQ